MAVIPVKRERESGKGKARRGKANDITDLPSSRPANNGPLPHNYSYIIAATQLDLPPSILTLIDLHCYYRSAATSGTVPRTLSPTSKPTGTAQIPTVVRTHLPTSTLLITTPALLSWRTRKLPAANVGTRWAPWSWSSLLRSC